ncbi:MAG: aldehyde dehydrogenase family protein [Acidibacillus sp.]|uniref:NAD/NADP-dependent betaine aldehyde dehydrogenase n=1 Tax=Sulfoacidibacillus ferrooxidans TaxID=2005001 RepID=A0A9X1VDE3_9BACL|nr:aldehyde dehydrogenase family protein [Sulfoacidibacillus ferrooxidans]MCI0184042.1 NAD/NADP-dependent betaine aldehyde dehydrogenase [Sulfoacidibacillus ferrooxidans]MCY0892723.1 aldehyde dehydrogenase family protein [Acidibacillus sp.]
MLLKDTYQLIINGKHVDSENGEFFETENPATGEVIAKVAKATRQDVDRAVDAARQALTQGKWARFSAAKRSQVLNKIAAILRERFDELCELEVQNSGKSLANAKGQVLQAIEDFELYAAAALVHEGKTKSVPNGFLNYTVKEPVGVCAQIIPWNYPFMMAAWKLAPALAAGCTIILKPASLTPITAIVLTEICQEAGVPDGVINVITGSGADVGAYLVEHPGVDKVAFTGETSTGKDIMARASQTIKRVTLELGGKSPNIVFADADFDAAIDGALFGIYYNTGQSCEARSRLFVHESIYDAFVDAFVEKAKKLRMGNPLESETHVGAIISDQQVRVIDGYVQSAKAQGARVVYGGMRPEGATFERGHWYMPTVIADVNNHMKVAQEEIFGPVIVIIPFANDNEVIAMANDTIYGLAASLWTQNFGRAHRVAAQLKAGIIMINNPFSAFPGLPFGGYKQSGFGRELAIESLDLYTETKSILAYIGEKPLNPFGIK